MMNNTTTFTEVDRTDNTTVGLTVQTLADGFGRHWTIVGSADGFDLLVTPTGRHIDIGAGCLGADDGVGLGGVDRTTLEALFDFLLENA